MSSILNDSDLSIFLENAKRYFENGKFNATIANCKKVLEFDDENVEAYLYMGKALHSFKKYRSAVGIFEKLEKITPDDPENLSWLADSYLLASEYEKSASTIRRALVIEPKNKDYLYISGIANYHLKNLEESKEAFKELIKFDPNNYEYSMWLGNILTYEGARTIDDNKFDEINKRLSDKDIKNHEEALIYYRKAERLANSKEEKMKVQRVYGNSLMYNKMYPEAIEYFDKIIKADETRSDIFQAKAYAHRCIEENETAIDCYFKSLSSNKLSLAALLNLIKLLRSESGRTDDLKEFLKDLKPEIECGYEKDGYILKHIISETKDIVADIGEVRYNILNLMSYIEEIKSLRKYSEPELKDSVSCIAHYTKIGTLKCLVGINEDCSKFRLQNVAYMNDPSEGTIFWSVLDELSPKLKELVDDNPNESLSNKCIKSLHYSNTYLASFSQNNDKLPLWTQYAENGKGCCIVFDSSFFDIFDESFNNGSYFQPLDTKNSDYQIPEKYCLYNIYYVGNETDNKIYPNDLDTKILEPLKSIADTLEILFSFKENAIKELSLSLVDQIRYLFKSKDYEHEQELRIVKFSNKHIVKSDKDHFRVPHLFIELEKEIEIKEVVFGPKAVRVSEIVPFIMFKGNVKGLRVSKIKYQ